MLAPIFPDGSSTILSPASNELARENSLAAAIVDAVREPLILLNKDLRVVTASRSFYHIFAIDPREAEGRLLYELRGGEWDIPGLRDLLETAVSSKKMIDNHELEHEFRGLGRRILCLNTRHVADARNPEAVLLLAIEDITARHDNEMLKEELLRQKDVLLLEIQHRVANSLQLIASILLLKMRVVTSEETRLHLRDAHQRVMAVATVQQQLCETHLGDRIEIGSYLARLCASLAASMISDGRALTVHSSASGSTAIPSHAVSVGLVVTELVINAIKHGFPDGQDGHIAVDFAGEGAGWQLSVSDNGVGRSDVSDKVQHIGLGTSIVEALARQLKARISISDNAPGMLVSLVHAA
jgi:two-component sensor histidine kinase